MRDPWDLTPALGASGSPAFPVDSVWGMARMVLLVLGVLVWLADLFDPPRARFRRALKRLASG